MKRNKRGQAGENVAHYNGGRGEVVTDRTARNCYPEAPRPVFAAPIPNSTVDVASGYAINSVINLPNYQCTDEYGRVYQAQISYGPLPVCGPVPVATPSKIIQTQPISVPYNNQ